MNARLEPARLSTALEEYRFPLSFAQQRLWFLEQLEGPGATYNVRLPVKLLGPLDLTSLQAAVDYVVSRHETLRTRLVMQADEPQQVIAASAKVQIETLSAAATDRGGIAEQLSKLAAQPFDLATGPLLRVYLLRVSSTEHRLLLLTHHSISDAWSSGVLFRDIAAAYTDYAQGREPNRPELPVQYADYAVWQREWLQGPELDKQIEYWHGQLAHAPALLPLPTDRPRPARQTYSGSRWGHGLDPQLSAGLQALARTESSTLFMLLLAAYAVLLSRYSGSDDLVIGAPVAGRQRAELEELVGFFANTLALRVDLSGAPSFRELLGRVRALSLEAFAHQELPFEKLVEVLKPERQLSHSPVFQVMFVLQNTPWDAQPMHDLDVSPGEIDPGKNAKFDLTLSASVFNESLWLNFEYNTDLFDQSTIEAYASAYEELLRSIAADPSQSILTLPLSATAPLDGPLQRWNDTALDYDSSAKLAELIAQQARRSPDAIAVLFEKERWSYAELQARAEAIAAQLRGAGAAENVLVALCLDRGFVMLASVLGVLGSGAAFLPLDPAHPPSRRRDMLLDSGAALLITDQPGLFENYSGGLFSIDPQARILEHAKGHRHPEPMEADETLAYLIYTSGSTGRPKAVMVPQRAVINFLNSMAQEPGIASTDAWLAVTTLSFDISVLELLLPLMAGARVIVAPASSVKDAESLAKLLERTQPTIMQATPSTWRLLVNIGWQGAPDLKILCGGEALDPGLAARLLNCGDSLWNLYGPTETTIWSTLAQVRDASSITIGQPIANTQVWICDVNLNLQPVGVPGELCIGGAGVAQGYLGQAALTAERFVADPFSAVSGARLYRTGDRARWRADGELELLGRLDRQVKLRGFRIELGEIEAALSGCQGVSAAVVDLHRRGDGESRLVAWVVGEGWQAESLRAELAQSLPDYMLPSAWVALEELPLTPNGKVDRRGLPAPQIAALRVAGRGPGSALEASVCDVYAAVLGLVSVPATADFFALGGHSLLATQLVARLRDVLQVELPLRVVFEAPTPEGLAAWMSQHDKAVVGATSVPIPAAGTRDAVPASAMQQRLWFLDQLQPGSSVYNLAWSANLQGELDVGALQAAVDALVLRHESLRTSFRVLDGEPQQFIDNKARLSVDHQQVSADELAATLQAYVSRPFDLQQAPLWRVGVFAQSATRQILVVCIHHIIADGWSLGLLFRELGQLYCDSLAGRESKLPNKPLQYADFALWQRDLFRGPELARQLDYWKKTLAGAPPQLPLPTDQPRPAVPAHRGERLSQHFDADLLAKLHELCKQQGATLYMVLLAAFKTLLARWTGAEDMVLGTPIAGRARTELEGVIGFFVNTLPLRTDLSGNPKFSTLLARVKALALEAYAHPDLPFERLVDELKLPRDLGRSPLFQVMFNLHNEPKGRLDMTGLDVSFHHIQRATTKFDMSVSATETAEGLMLTVEYDRDLFNSSTISNLVAQYALLLEQVSDSPELRIGELRFAAEAAMPAAALPRWSQAVSIGTVFAQVVAADASRLAISTPAYRWSYGALAEYTQRVASAVLAQGGALGDCIGLLGAQDAPVVAGLLGIVTAGRAYVPLDSSVPVARLQALAQTTGLQAVVADSEHQACAAQLGLPVLVIDTQADGRHTPPVEVAVPAATLAYVLSTSGSTGAPKQVGQSHAGVLTQVARYVASLAIQADDRLSWLSSVGFDAAVQDIFGALFSGASLHPVDMRAGVAAAVQVDALVAAQVSVVHATPTVYRHLFGSELSCRHALEMIRAVVLGGEVARRADFELFRSRFAPGTRFINGYGLTECTLVSQWQAEHDTAVAGETLPVGHPVPGLTVQIEDAPGAASWQGEIVLRGAGLAHSDWSAGQGFVAPSSYRTGDWGRWLLSGQLAYVGRRDDQVKLRGLRVSLGELETVLRAYGPVAECAVRLHGEQLVAYVSGLETAQLAGLKAYAQAHLAPWQQPGAWVVLARLPRLANGKLARSELPAPARAEGLPPRGALEEALAEIWQGLLGVDGIHREDDFFALGGHSLLATRLIARIRQQLQIDIPLLAIFEHSTVTGLAQAIEAAAQAVSSDGSPPELQRQTRITTSRRPM